MTSRLSSSLVLFASCVLLVGVAGCGGGPSGDADGGPTDTGAPDAAGDGGRVDGGGCASDLQCDDGLFCNGSERCVMGRCAAGTAPSCDDTIDCTVDSCNEARGMCSHAVPDADHDGHGVGTCRDASGAALGDDCDDTDANAFPGNLETCDAMQHDEDCDPLTHGGIDNDSDGFEDAACCNGTMCGTDCNDGNRSVNTAASEVCNTVDDDCDTNVDEGVGVPVYVDADRDGYGVSTATPEMRCSDAAGYSVRDGDCDDANVAVHPGQPELCDMVDNDCNMLVDDNTMAVTWYLDHDGDGFGDPAGGTISSCNVQMGYSLLATDCDDSTSSRSPRAPELCNAIDDDCNGRADFQIPMMAGNLEDDDNDHVADSACGMPFGLDCNDLDPNARPSAVELCNGRDDDCDGMVDEMASSATFHRDADGDGYGDPTLTMVACSPPTGYVLDGTDCNDASAARHPGGTEACNATDDDCDTRIDEAPASTMCAAGEVCTVGLCHAPITSYLTPYGNYATVSIPRDVTYTLSSPSAGALITYTLDGSDPTTSASAIRGVSPVSFRTMGSTTIRWFASFATISETASHGFAHVTDASRAVDLGMIAENASLNGQGPTITVDPGASVTLDVDLTYWQSMATGYCPGCGVQPTMGSDATGAPIDCIESGGGYFPGTATHRTITLAAPAVSGTYPIRFGEVLNYGCYMPGYSTGWPLLGVVVVR